MNVWVEGRGRVESSYGMLDHAAGLGDMLASLHCLQKVTLLSGCSFLLFVSTGVSSCVKGENSFYYWDNIRTAMSGILWESFAR